MISRLAPRVPAAALAAPRRAPRPRPAPSPRRAAATRPIVVDADHGDRPRCTGPRHRDATDHTASDTKTRRYFFDRAYLAVPPGTTASRSRPGATRRASRVTADRRRTRCSGSTSASGSAPAATADCTYRSTSPTPAARRPGRPGSARASSRSARRAYASDDARRLASPSVFPPGYTIDGSAGQLQASPTDAADEHRPISTGRLPSRPTFFAYFVADRPSAFASQARTSRSTASARSRFGRGRRRPGLGRADRRARRTGCRPCPTRSACRGRGPTRSSSPRRVEPDRRGYAGRLRPGDGASRSPTTPTRSWPPRGGPRLVRRRSARRSLGERGLRIVVRAARAVDQARGTAPVDALTDSPAAEAACPAQCVGPERGEDAGGRGLRLCGVPRARPPDRRARRHRRACSRSGGRPRHGTLGRTEPPDAREAKPASRDRRAAPDWRGLLDLLEDRTGKPFDDLWRAWVVRPEEAALLDARAAARASYARTIALADGWAIPRAARDAMRAWRFDAAEEHPVGCAAR